MVTVTVLGCWIVVVSISVAVEFETSDVLKTGTTIEEFTSSTELVVIVALTADAKLVLRLEVNVTGTETVVEIVTVTSTSDEEGVVGKPIVTSEADVVGTGAGTETETTALEVAVPLRVSVHPQSVVTFITVVQAVLTAVYVDITGVAIVALNIDPAGTELVVVQDEVLKSVMVSVSTLETVTMVL